MSVFHFRLQKVLDLRAEKEKEAAGKLAAARRDADAAVRARALLEAVRAESRRQLTAAHGRGDTVGRLQNLSFLLEQMQQRIEAADAACRSADESVHDRLQDFNRALAERRALDELRKKHREQWSAAEAASELKRMDEIAITRHQRSSLSSQPGEDDTP